MDRVITMRTVKDNLTALEAIAMMIALYRQGQSVLITHEGDRYLSEVNMVESEEMILGRTHIPMVSD